MKQWSLLIKQNSFFNDYYKFLLYFSETQQIDFKLTDC